MWMHTHWRLALMFDAEQGDHAAFAERLERAGPAIRAAAAGHPVRIGMADLHPDLGTRGDSYDVDAWRTVDGAIEVTLPDVKSGEMAEICRALRPILTGLINLSSIEIMAGPMFSMVPVRKGNTFLSLAFRRDPGVTSQQFRDWWFAQHAKMAIPVLGPGLLAYDQVHVDQAANDAMAAAFGVPACVYDAYDNLTWDDRYAFLKSCSDLEGMNLLNQDEKGHIDNASRRHALMYEIM
jgi:hypothetical protein